MSGRAVPVARRQLEDGRFKEIAALERDPVCGMLVEPEQAVRVEWEGETFYFCAAGCREQFEHEQRAASNTLEGYIDPRVRG
jgi:YHS domain-containing protein